MVACAAWATWVIDTGGKIAIDDSIKSPYTWRTGLLRALQADTPWCDQLKHLDNRFVPLCNVKGEHRTRTLIERVLPVLHLRTPRANQAVGAAIKELAYNAKEHPKAHRPAAFSAGWFPGDRRVSFAFADTGIGVRQSLLNKGLIEESEDDRVAIEKAFQPGLTGAGDQGVPTAPDNAGMGLHITRTYAQGCGGSMALASGHGRFTEAGLGSETWATVESTWTGTLVSVTLHPDAVGNFPSLASSDTPVWRLVHSGDAPMPVLTLRPPVNSVGFSDDKTWFSQHRSALAGALRSGRQVQIDFGGASHSTHSALNALLGEPLRNLGEQAATLIWVTGMAGPIRRVFQVVVADALATGQAERS